MNYKLHNEFHMIITYILIILYPLCYCFFIHLIFQYINYIYFNLIISLTNLISSYINNVKYYGILFNFLLSSIYYLSFIIL